MPGACLLALFVLAVPTSASAQFGNAWLTLVQDDSVLQTPFGQPHGLLFDTKEKDFAVGDVNHDGLPDLVVVRKQQASFPGKEQGYLFLNENGILVECTQQYSSSATPGDLGLAQPTDARDVEIADLDGDGWQDLVQCQVDLLNLTAAADKILTHPRIHINRRVQNSLWQGLIHEDNRIPQLQTTGGVNGILRFPDLTAGDCDGDGDIDLYFVDHDVDENGHDEPLGGDLNDRLLINDGNGFFTDATSLHLTAAMTQSAFGAECQFADMNGDGKLDIVKISTLTESPNSIRVLYNDATATAPNGTGSYDAAQNNAVTGQPYNVAVADLNQDGRLDLIDGDAGNDKFRLNLGNTAANQVSWGPSKNLTWLTGSDDQDFSGQMHARDYDLDGWNDLLTSDVHVDLIGCSRRTQIYHNRAGAPGTTSVVLAEEKQQSGTGGWFGAIGWSVNYPKGVFDAANIDIDRDGDLDLILGMCTGSDIWFNQTITGVVCQDVVALGGKGNATLSVCGGDLSTGTTATVKIAGGSANGFAILLVSSGLQAVNGFGGTLWTNPILGLVFLPLDAAGGVQFSAPGGGGPQTFYLQAMTVAPGGFAPNSITNVVKLMFKP